MILHLIFYFVVFCVIFAYNILDNGYIPFIVDIIFVSISIISVVVCMILRAGIKCSFETEMLTVRRNEKNDISIRLRNKSFIPAPYCKFRIKFIMGNGKKKTRRCNVFCTAKGISSATFKFSDSNCEMVRAVVKRVYIYDFFHMLVFSKKINLNADILVMPKEPEDVIISKLRQDMNGDNDNLYSDKKAGNDPTEIFAIREYAPGDKIRNIHWKISAKMGQTMVKDYGLPLFEKDTVIIEKFSNKNVSVANEIYDLLYSLIYAMTQRGFGLNVCFVNGIYTEKRIENETDIHNLFAELYQSDSKDNINVAEIYYAGHDKSSNRIFYVTDVLNKISMGRMDILKERGPVYYLIPKSRGGGEYLIKYD